MSMTEHKRLLQIVKCLPDDYEPFGAVKRWEDPDKSYNDCSCGCRWAKKLDGSLGNDWVVCINPDSHRCGLLTFEHQGCLNFEGEDNRDPPKP